MPGLAPASIPREEPTLTPTAFRCRVRTVPRTRPSLPKQWTTIAAAGCNRFTGQPFHGMVEKRSQGLDYRENRPGGGVSQGFANGGPAVAVRESWGTWCWGFTDFARRPLCAGLSPPWPRSPWRQRWPDAPRRSETAGWKNWTRHPARWSRTVWPSRPNAPRAPRRR